MDEDDVYVTSPNNTLCPNLEYRRDCDRDVERYCTKSAGECKHQIVLVDCDGDTVTLCRE